MEGSASIAATYRLQFNKDFTFRDATKLLDYFSELGITHIYASPILRSRAGSTHGYDVVDPTRLNPELGTEADFFSLQTELRNRGMGLILDIVPNHMSAGSENSWWMDVLEHGPESVYASYFDVDWHPPSRSLDSKILLPVLGRPFAEALENGEFKLIFSEGRLFLQYFESLFPLAPKTYSEILGKNIENLRGKLGSESTAYQEYSGIAAAFAALPSSETVKAGEAGDKRLRFEALRERLRQLVNSNADVEGFLHERLGEFTGRRGDPASFSPLERLLADQFYVLSYWQNVNEEINYRRFFTITDLVGVRVEDPLVFEATHGLIMRLAAQPPVDALRIDHIDGLRDPLAYLNRLREQLGKDSPVGHSREISLFVEKILGRTERLPREWPVSGTTGYDFLNALNSVFVDPKGAKCIEEVYDSFVGKKLAYGDLLYQKKKLIMSTLLGVEMRSLGHQLSVLADKDRYARDLSRSDLIQALFETTAHVCVYRTYIRNLEVAREDTKIIEQAIEEARARKFYLQPVHFDFIRDVLLVKNRLHLLPDQREARLNFVMRWQQFTGPLMAKAFEDTLLYVYNPLISLNEVGGEPRPTVAASETFSDFISDRRKHWPNSMNATTTHDTKRSEDVRARINVLSEIPGEWKGRLEQWSKLNAKYKTQLNGQPVPDRNEEIFLYQTLLGMWPTDGQDEKSLVERLQAYAIKATREAMVHTRWTLPNTPHENALKKFVASILQPATTNPFLRDFVTFQKSIAYSGMVNGLSQTLLKIISPGIPDFYQGSELWDLRLVDPDNRQPIDFAKRGTMLAVLKGQTESSALFSEQLTGHWQDGQIKLYTIWKALNFRREAPDLFSKGDFLQLDVTGPHAQHILAILRRHKREWALFVAPRWLTRAKGTKMVYAPDSFWSETKIRLPDAAPKSWENIFTGENFATVGNQGSLALGEMLLHFPVALLSSRKRSKADD
ncbi:MAG: malto-oligosyltrehalose synthase [Candidatus Acidoferrum typicum]|nr:malto-oligosyltrehalose synthase [Candidatus Acidoferrum typicum]